jgi:hypothetical protein
MTAADRATKKRRVREALDAVTRPRAEYAVRIAYPGQEPYIYVDGKSAEAAGAIADQINADYGLGEVATVVPR